MQIQYSQVNRRDFLKFEFFKKFNFFRILLASVLLSIKYNEDDFYSNTFYAKVGGISLKEINLLEFEFMKLIQFNLFVQEEVYLKYKEYLLNYWLFF